MAIYETDDSTTSRDSFEVPIDEFRRELISIADWWIEHSLDETNGGFFGEIDAASRGCRRAHKGIVLNSRLLWFFSELSRQIDNERYRDAATRAYDYLQKYFLDQANGGYFWELDCLGNVVRDRKQVYAQAFCIYGLVSYFRWTKDPVVLEQAITLFHTIESRCRDARWGGYIEAFSRKWEGIDDYRLSESDRNLPKTMNTHLHVLEAYTSLHRVVRTEETSSALENCIRLFEDHIVDHDDLRLRMFLEANWEDHSEDITYGHEIEFSWLLCEAAHTLGQDYLTKRSEQRAVQMAKRVMQMATGTRGEILEKQTFGESVDPESAWWVQAESLVGFLNAYEITGDPRFTKAFLNVWEFIKAHHKVSPRSEWTWSPNNGQPVTGPVYLGGFWKAPYHNGRAMMEVLRRLEKQRP